MLVGNEGINPNDPALLRLMAEAEDARRSLTGESEMATVETLPSRSVVGTCRLCGECRQLTREHIPPRSSGNAERMKAMSFESWLNRTSLESERPGEIRQGGISGFTLCGDCNSLTGRKYGAEYKDWAVQGWGILDQLPIGEIDENPKEIGVDIAFGGKWGAGVRPGALIRQVLSCLCSLGGAWQLAELYPAIRRIVLHESVEPLPDGVDVEMFLFAGPKPRTVSPQAKFDLERSRWQWVVELAFPPFAFLMTIATNQVEGDGDGPLIGEWTQVDTDRRMRFSASMIPVGFGWTPYPGDYRSKGAIEAQRRDE